MLSVCVGWWWYITPNAWMGDYLIASQGFEYDNMRQKMFNEKTDRVFSFNSAKKRSTTVVHLDNGRVRVYVKVSE